MDAARPASITLAPWWGGLSAEHSQEKVTLQVDQAWAGSQTLRQHSLLAPLPGGSLMFFWKEAALHLLPPQRSLPAPRLLH